MVVKNRVMMPAMVTNLATRGHFVTYQLISWYAKRAQASVGLIIIEATSIDDPIGTAMPLELCIDDDKYVTGLCKLADVVHSYGTKIGIQLHHTGPKSHYPEGKRTVHFVAPSPIPVPGTARLMAHELSKKDIKELVEKYGLGARRARQAGFDCVEVLAAHGYLLNNFLSPHTNKRRDEYGGSLEARLRILEEIIQKIAKEAGSDFPVIAKVPGDDYVDGGITPEESITMCKILENKGISALTVTGGGYPDAKFTHIGPKEYPQGWQVHLAEKIRKQTKVPIVAISKIDDPEFAETVLSGGKADMVAIARGLIADPEFLAKAERNEADKIVRCEFCLTCSVRIARESKPIRCKVNPLAGRECTTAII